VRDLRGIDQEGWRSASDGNRLWPEFGEEPLAMLLDPGVVLLVRTDDEIRTV
jgi:hypothetical protein